ncbi:hypothetical protein CHH28_02750 [Bacterioplanes sanyensis]|uniref:Uncharacterized protein n=1 Tax=Bacterioplanes sanyensis TaxID=1249553 RepID=A0A222FEY7_9GAMM|nr:hypothetical protein CHH28_02750 [Bacterioplanes sanyensis]
MHLLAGKVALSYFPIISRLIGNGYLQAPTHISPAIASPSLWTRCSSLLLTRSNSNVCLTC